MIECNENKTNRLVARSKFPICAETYTRADSVFECKFNLRESEPWFIRGIHGNKLKLYAHTNLSVSGFVDRVGMDHSTYVYGTFFIFIQKGTWEDPPSVHSQWPKRPPNIMMRQSKK